jgi:exodeoxyribonuclease V beta subunit
VAAGALRQFGFASEWRDTVVAMLDDVTRAALGPNGPYLGDVPMRQRLNELEFHFPFRHFDPRRLAGQLAPFDRDGRLQRQLMSLQPERVGGYLKGFIDMVFESGGRWYIVDYKSNWLGMRRDDYLPARLAEVIVEECYGLQYLIYLVALHRWLRHRLPGYDYETHVGGVFYLFVRAVGPVGDAGIFADRPDVALVQALDGYLHDGGGQ